MLLFRWLVLLMLLGAPWCPSGSMQGPVTRVSNATAG